MAITLRKPGTSSGRVFRKNLNRAHRFLYFFDRDAECRDFPNHHAVVLLESAIVFGVAALDAYLHDIILEIVPSYGPISARSTKQIRDIVNRDPALVIRLATAGDDIDRRGELYSALADSLSTKVFHGPKAVQETLEFLDCQITWPEFNDATGLPGTDSELKRITELRHGLVHRLRGPHITRDKAEAALKLIESIAFLINRRVTERYNIP